MPLGARKEGTDGAEGRAFPDSVRNRRTQTRVDGKGGIGAEEERGL